MNTPPAGFRKPHVPTLPLRVATVQMESLAGDKKANFAKMEVFVRKAARRCAKLLVFPECCITGYWFIRNLSPARLLELSEPVPDGPSVRRLAALAREHGLGIGAGLVERGRKGAFHNSYVVALPNGKVHVHRKLHSFEHDLIKSGEVYTVFDTPWGWRAAVLICYDNNINENVRVAALMGADVVLAPHQTGGCRSNSPHCMGLVDRRLWENRRANPAAIEREFRGDKGRGWLMRWLPSRAHDNGVFLVFSNGVGVDDDEVRTGNAMVLDPYGRVLVETWKARDEMLVCDLDGRLLARATGRRWIRSRRPELYALLAKRTGIERDTRQVRFEE
ncbi:MAG: nitrilase family protein [Verrucomicrobiia bacterium]